jgi:uracil-DNA glycosylase
VPMGFCFPGLDAHGGDLPPRRECARAWRAQLFEAMPQFELILLIGGYAQTWHLGERAQKDMTANVQAWKLYVQAENRPMFLPLPHPSWRNNGWLRKNPWFEAEMLPFLRGEVRRLIA